MTGAILTHLSLAVVAGLLSASSAIALTSPADYPQRSCEQLKTDGQQLILKMGLDFSLTQNDRGALASNMRELVHAMQEKHCPGTTPGSSKDTDPVVIGKITYNIPKDYVCWECGHWGIPTLKPPDLPELTLRAGPRSLDPNSQSQIERFRKGLKDFPELLNRTEVTTRFGYQVYKSLPPEGVHVDGMGETFVNESTGIMFGCSLHTDTGLETCGDTVELADGNEVTFLFPISAVETIPGTEDKIRKLIASFPVSRGRY
jgi:hypothetical protein